ncbi:MAG: ammonium transporter [Anaerolineae bacterium]|nr:ammonium transporter [Anaerolineae bacterium]
MNQSLLDTAWVLLCSGLVFLMQAGFTCLESGLTRSKNSINVAIKNLIDIGLSVLLFWAFGYGLMFGLSQAGWVGSSGFFWSTETTPHLIAFFIFQAMFCGTATTILSGAIAERINFKGYTIMVVLLSGLIYPIFGHWAWNGAADGDKIGWLGHWGFVDFAGSTVVHSVGGWISLAAVLVIGPRMGRFVAGARPNKIPGSNMPLAVLGVFLLWLGWFGFNGGSTLSLNDRVPVIIFNTILAGSAGSTAVLLFDWRTYGRFQVELLMNGVLAGLVAITASAPFVSPLSAIVIGAVGGFVMMAVDFTLEKFEIDDAVGAIPVHLGAGIWGTLAVAIFGNLTLMGTGLTRLEQAGVQLAGIIVCGLWAFGLGYLLIKSIDRRRPLRVSLEDEQIGLNVSEHGATTEILDFLKAMEHQAATGDINLRVPVEPFTEIGQMAGLYNKVLDALQKAVMTTEAIVRDIQDGIITFSKDGLLTSFNPGAEAMFGFSAAQAIGQPFSMLLASPNEAHHPLDPSFWSLNLIGRRQELAGVRCDHSTFPLEVLISQGQVGNEILFTGVLQDITERKLAEDLIKNQRAFLRQVIDINPHFIFAKDRQGRFTLANKSFAHAHGTTVEQLIGKTDAAIINNQATVAQYQRDDLTVITSKRDLFYPEQRIEKPDGTISWRQTIKRPLINDAGEVDQLLCVVTDITDQKKAEQSLQNQIERMRALYEVFSTAGLSFEEQIEAVLSLGCRLLNLDVGIVSRIDETNNQCQVQHIVRSVAVGLEKEQILPFDKTPCHITLAHKDAMSISHMGQSEWRTHPSYEKTKIESYIGTPIRINKQRYGTLNFFSMTPKTPPFEPVDLDFIHLMGNWINATLEQQLSAKEIQDSEARLRQVLASVSAHIYMTEFTQEGQLVNGYISPNVENLTGYPQTKFLADWSFWPTQVIHPDDRADAAKQAKMLLGGGNSEIEYRLIRADGEIVWVRDSGRVETHIDSQNRYIYGVVIEITHQKAAEQALIEAHERAMEASRLKSELLANVSHDLKTPLGAIYGYTEMLQVGVYGPITNEQKKITYSIMESAGQLLNFVNNLLDQARIESGNVTLKKVPVSLKELAEMVYFSTNVDATAKHINLTYDIDPNLSPIIDGDIYWLRQILINLVGNAIKFTPQNGSVEFKFYLSDASNWVIQVSDTGIGIPDAARAYIFEPFRQVDGTATRGNFGSGLGLSIVHKLTQMMEGRLELQSKLDAGSTFTITLPLITAYHQQYES